MLLIKNAKIIVGEYTEILSNQIKDLEIITDILIENETIKKIEKNITPNNNMTKIIDAQFNYVIPGVVDAHVHMRDPGLCHKEDFMTGSMAAAKGGVTTFLDMPNTLPFTTSEISFNEKKKNCENRSYVDYGFHFGGSKQDNSQDILAISNLVASTKIFLNMSTGNMLVKEDNILKNLFTASKIISVHAEEEKVEEAINLSRKFNKTLYLCHLSTASEVKLLKKAKKEGLKVFGEVTPHHLFLNEAMRKESFEKNMLLQMKPDLKSIKDNEALWKALNEGIIDTIGTDHAPHTYKEKLDKITFGIPGIENSLEMMLLGYKLGKINLFKIIKSMSENPAKIFNISNKGKLQEGYDADLVILDLNNSTTINNTKIISKCKWTPYKGFSTGGTIVTTILRGHIIYEKGNFSNPLGKEVLYFK
ncbi:MAG: dihydroorotase [Fusobacteriaceae bacterium]